MFVTSPLTQTEAIVFSIGMSTRTRVPDFDVPCQVTLFYSVHLARNFDSTDVERPDDQQRDSRVLFGLRFGIEESDLATKNPCK